MMHFYLLTLCDIRPYPPVYAARVITVSLFSADLEVCDLAPLVMGAVLRSITKICV